LLGNVHEKHVIDLCAAPGGKTAQLCKAGALPIAVDRSASRLKRLRDNLARLSFDPTIVQADATVWQPDSHVDAVLLDAPCSATGTLRRHPEIAWRRGPSDVTKLVTLQKKLVKSASQMLKPGGRLVVVTCSLQEEEGPGLARFAASLDSLIPDPVQPNELPSCFATAATKEGWLRTHPAMLEEQGYCDGFFAARFRRKI
jgi:16S rRNA (cytosine967-C5)-methyltransferase